MLFLILGAFFCLLVIILAITLVIQLNVNQVAVQYAETHAQPHTYHITSITKSDDKNG